MTTEPQARDYDLRALAVRLALIWTGYRKPLNWTDALLAQSEKHIRSLFAALQHAFPDGLVRVGECPESVIKALSDDLSTPKALAEIYALAKQVRREIPGSEKAEQLAGAMQLLGF
jgi:cysteinyl-tRNA synthetase